MHKNSNAAFRITTTKPVSKFKHANLNQVGHWSHNSTCKGAPNLCNHSISKGMIYVVSQNIRLMTKKKIKMTKGEKGKDNK